MGDRAEEHLMAKLEAERHAAEEANARLRARLENKRSIEVQGFEKEIELWKGFTSSSPKPELFPRYSFLTNIRNNLCNLVPNGHSRYHKCAETLQAEIVAVDKVTNIANWRAYVQQRQTMCDKLQHRGNIPRASEFAPHTGVLQSCFPDINLKLDANEVLLLHGTKAENAKMIAEQGFDDRLAKEKCLYGSGVYFTTDWCKVCSFCKQADRDGTQCVVVARVLLGHAFMAKKPMIGSNRPPAVQGMGPGVLHDSIVVKPGIPKSCKDANSKQVHWEFVTERINAYPEMIIRFRKGSNTC